MDDGGRHKSRREIETQIENGQAMAAIFLDLGYRPSFVYEKFRTEWSDGTGHVVIDETPVGNFGEIEGPPEWIDATAAALGINREQYIKESYAELFENWKHETRCSAADMTFAAIGSEKSQ
jgi:adenylate cyclase class 2